MTEKSDSGSANAKPFRKKLGIKAGVLVLDTPRPDTGVRLPGMVGDLPRRTHRDAAAEAKRVAEAERLHRQATDDPVDKADREIMRYRDPRLEEKDDDEPPETRPENS